MLREYEFDLIFVLEVVIRLLDDFDIAFFCVSGGSWEDFFSVLFVPLFSG